MENRLSTFAQGSKVADVAPEPKRRPITLTGLNTGPQLQEENGNDITIRSVLTFIKSDAHVYGGRFGRVDLEAKMGCK
ncbi:hypothetical protein NECAME_17290 [Necator americanus]|uniref:Uncharacterized protein n=1 Tax=Necator americanus TaxID=51031 RepID=W2TQP5_NECAM|nr:hypothetical protein NECAME_17290 [Necator americanus]ETN83999.1 hypothetical protein NECAME_17290 [Necator americanus]